MRDNTHVARLTRKSKKAVKILQEEGAVSLAIKSLQKVQKKQQKISRAKKREISFLVDYRDGLQADWVSNPYKPSRKKRTGPYRINWVMSPPDKGGGHQNIFRFITALERAGHECRVYLYSTTDFKTITEVKNNVASYPWPAKAEISWLKGPMAEADAIFATGWETAYPVFNDPSDARRFYFVQDFEPYFYPLGSEYILAENTYKFGFHGITAGKWLATKLSREYDMPTDHYEFGSDKELYKFTNDSKRKEIFFYARPVTMRRGFELGIMTLELVAKALPDYTITLAGWDVSDYKIPFKYNNLKTLRLDELSDVYNRCAAALVISLTNMSLLPLELLASGTIPIVNKGDNNQMVSDNPFIVYEDPSPAALARAIIETVQRKDLPQHARKASESVGDLDWRKSCNKMEKILTRELTNG